MNRTACKHHKGYQHERCRLGINYTTLVGGPPCGWVSRLPCTNTSLSYDQVECDKYEEPTAEEIAEEEQSFKAHFANVMKARTHIVKMIEKHSVSHGKTPCPVCTDGTLGFSQASNGHIHATCSTEGCVSWME